MSDAITATVTYGNKAPYDKLDDWQMSANPWTVALRRRGRSLTLDYWTGSAITDEPTAKDVLESLALDASSGENDFEEFCKEFGYDEDSRRALRIWKACRSMSVRLKRFLGNDYESIVYSSPDEWPAGLVADSKSE